MSNKKHCTCDIPFSDCPHAMETPHGDKWYCMLPKPKSEIKEIEPRIIANKKQIIIDKLKKLGAENEISGT